MIFKNQNLSSERATPKEEQADGAVVAPWTTSQEVQWFCGLCVVPSLSTAPDTPIILYFTFLLQLLF